MARRDPRLLDGNRALLAELVADLLPELTYRPPEATYLGWLDCEPLGLPASPATFFREAAGVALTDGALCGASFEQHARLVFAMPRPILDEAVRSMAAAVRGLRGARG